MPWSTLVDGLAFPEGPRWRDGALWWSDLQRRTVNRVGLDGAAEVVVALGDAPSGIGFLPDGTPLVVSMGAKRLLRIVGGGDGRARTEVHADLGELPGDLLNDMLVDDEGRAYVGLRTRAMLPDVAPLPDDRAVDGIALVQPDGTAGLAAEHLLSPNGMVVTPDGRTLVVSETYGQRLAAFERRHDGTLGARRPFAATPGAYPDGNCLDADGMLWVASPYSGELLRLADGGAVSERHAQAGAVACALGGPVGTTLFLLCVDTRALPVPGSGRASSADPATLGAGRILTMEAPAPHAGLQ